MAYGTAADLQFQRNAGELSLELGEAAKLAISQGDPADDPAEIEKRKYYAKLFEDLQNVLDQARRVESGDPIEFTDEFCLEATPADREVIEDLIRRRLVFPRVATRLLDRTGKMKTVHCLCGPAHGHTIQIDEGLNRADLNIAGLGTSMRYERRFILPDGSEVWAPEKIGQAEIVARLMKHIETISKPEPETTKAECDHNFVPKGARIQRCTNCGEER